MSANVELRIQGMELLRTQVLICGSCEHAKGNACGVSGEKITAHVGIHGKGLVPCPLGKQADERGHVRWPARWGVKWVGVPWPVRVWRWSKARDEGWMGVPGCGCVVVVKRAWLRMKGWEVVWVNR